MRPKLDTIHSPAQQLGEIFLFIKMGCKDEKNTVITLVCINDINREPNLNTFRAKSLKFEIPNTDLDFLFIGSTCFRSLQAVEEKSKN